MFFPETRVESRFDREMSNLRNRIEVAKDARSYLISISFTGSSADQAAQIVNAVAVEYAREKWMQKSREAVIAAEIELTRQRAVNGEKHPKVLQAIESLEVARADLKALMAEEIGRNSARTEDGIKLALPNHTPTSPKGSVILGLALLAGLLAGIVLAIRRDRRGLEPFDMASARQVVLTTCEQAAFGWSSGRRLIRTVCGHVALGSSRARHRITTTFARTLTHTLARRTAIASRLHNSVLGHILGRASPPQIGHSMEPVDGEPADAEGPDNAANSQAVTSRPHAAPVSD
jgi:hypothetical protein